MFLGLPYFKVVWIFGITKLLRFGPKVDNQGESQNVIEILRKRNESWYLWP